MDVRFSMATKKDKDSPEYATAGIMHFPDGTPKWLAYGFLAFAKVKLQGQFRRNDIPASWKGDAEKLAPGARDVGVREMTKEELLAAIMADGELRKQVQAKIEAEELAELEKETKPE